MKLLEAFKRQLIQCGGIQRVWLTSFNIDVEFIETFILPAVLASDQPRIRMDYEVLQQELNDREVDFRVFCDKRYIGPDQNKRTLIPIHGVSLAKRESATQKMGFSEDSLFHAKVIYIEGKNGRVLGAGSANLTLSGWGRNREVFQFVPVDEKLLYQSMLDFFRKLFDNVDIPCPLKNLRVFPQEIPRAQFCHSFQEKPFLQQLFGERHHQALAIWSPYFSKDLAGFIHHFQEVSEHQNLHIYLVADQVDGQYLRTRWTENLKVLLEEGGLVLHKSPILSDDRINMTHAKLWKTRTHLAIGSWNFTRCGANAENKDKMRWLGIVNAEAGLIFEDKAKIDAYLGVPLKVDASYFASDEQLLADALDVPEMLPFDLQVKFDWANLKYEVVGIWNANASINNSYSIRLPALGKPIPLIWRPRIKVLEALQLTVANPSALLTNHCYEILKDGKPCCTGFFVEVSAACRRAQQYDDLKSLFDAMVIEGPEPSVDDVSYRVQDDEEDSLYIEGLGLPEQSHVKVVSSDISYFRLFAASYQYAARLRSAKSLHSLEQWAFTRPGCLEELVDKTMSQLSASQSVIFQWFLAKEVNGLCNLARQLREAYKHQAATIASDRWRKLKINYSLPPKDADARYVELLEKEYSRMGRSWGNV